MTHILYGKPAVESIKNKLKKIFKQPQWQGKYIAIFLLQDHGPSKVYVSKKKQFGEKVGINVKIIDWTQVSNKDQLLGKISHLNNDSDCVGIVIQLPLPKKYTVYQAQILSSIVPEKDIDGLGGILFGLSQVGLIDFIPATPKAAIKILEYYNLVDFVGKKVAILGQSNLVGKPLILEIIKRGGNVFSFNHYLSNEEKKRIVKNVDIVFSATGQVHLITKGWTNPNQIIIDIGRGYKDGKSVGDVDFENIKEEVKAITPVPGGVGPLTVACLFENIIELDNLKNILNGWKNFIF